MSLRAATLAEVASVISTILIALWVVVPLYPDNRTMLVVPGLFALGFVVYSQRVRGESFEDIGLTGTHFGKALLMLAIPTVIAVILFGGIAAATNTLRMEGAAWYKLVTVPMWGVLQQFLLQAFLFRRIRSLVESDRAAIACAATLFAVVHLPNVPLTLLTLAGGIVWTWVYSRAPNLYALGISHGLMSLLVMTTLPRRILPTLSVGYKYFLSQSY
jgi:membrane protease YdiL (CAAX protease family)